MENDILAFKEEKTFRESDYGGKDEELFDAIDNWISGHDDRKAIIEDADGKNCVVTTHKRFMATLDSLCAYAKLPFWDADKSTWENIPTVSEAIGVASPVCLGYAAGRCCPSLKDFKGVEIFYKAQRRIQDGSYAQNINSPNQSTYCIDASSEILVPRYDYRPNKDGVSLAGTWRLVAVPVDVIRGGELPNKFVEVDFQAESVLNAKIWLGSLGAYTEYATLAGVVSLIDPESFAEAGVAPIEDSVAAEPLNEEQKGFMDECIQVQLEKFHERLKELACVLNASEASGKTEEDKRP